MAAEPNGDYTTLVVRLYMGADGAWYVSVDGTHQLEALPLKPVTLIIRLWQQTGTGIVRGSIRLHDGDQTVPIQTNVGLEELVRAWLLAGGAPPGPS
ncbi:MAG TPA: hypothetical protein VGD69_23680 [Herpetosiphonaceae bacterium]